MDRLDIPLPYGNTLVVLRDDKTYFVRLLRTLNNRKTFVTPKLPIMDSELRQLIETNMVYVIDLGDMRLMSDAGSLTVIYEYHHMPAGKAVIYGELKRFLDWAPPA